MVVDGEGGHLRDIIGQNPEINFLEVKILKFILLKVKKEICNSESRIYSFESRKTEIRPVSRFQFQRGQRLNYPVGKIGIRYLS